MGVASLLFSVSDKSMASLTNTLSVRLSKDGYYKGGVASVPVSSSKGGVASVADVIMLYCVK